MSASFALNCGALDLTVASGNDWRVSADYQGEAPSIEASSDALELRSPEGFGLRRQYWAVTLPAAQVKEIRSSSNASSVTATLAGADIDSLDVSLNAGDVQIDATGASVARVDISTNAGRVRLGVDSDTTGEMSANAGAMSLCVPTDATLRLRVREQLTFGHNLDDRGLTQSGEVWTREGAVGGPVVDLAVSGNAASFTLDPEGGC
jgi:hypothetical protein